MTTATKIAQIRLTRTSPAYWRVLLDNPPLDLMGSDFVLQIREIVTALETDDDVKVVIFESAVEGVFLISFHSSWSPEADIPRWAGACR